MKSRYKIRVLDKNSQVLYDISMDREVLTIGRQHDNDFTLNDGKLSRHHAELRLTTRGLYLQDLQSKNGLYLNGNRIAVGPPGSFLTPGDEIQVGSHTILILEDAPQPGSAPSPVATPLPGASAPPSPSSLAMPFGSSIDGTMVMSGSAGEETVFNAAFLIKKTRPRLIVVTAKERRRFEIQQIEISIGRTEQNGISIDHPSLSSLHSQIFLLENKFYVRDMNSTNGLFLNEVRIPEAVLENHAYLRFGAVGALFVQDPIDGEMSREISREISWEELIEKLLVLEKLTPSQASLVAEDIESKDFQVSESMIMRGYCTPAEWHKIYPQALMVKVEEKGKKLSLLLVVLICVGILIVALLFMVVFLLLNK